MRLKQARSLSSICLRNIYTANVLVLLHRLHVTFIDKDGEKHTFEVAKGDNLLDIAQANDIEMEGMRWMNVFAF